MKTFKIIDIIPVYDGYVVDLIKEWKIHYSEWGKREGFITTSQSLDKRVCIKAIKEHQKELKALKVRNTKIIKVGDTVRA